MKVQQKVYLFNEDCQDVYDLDKLGLVVNDKILARGGVSVLAKDLFVDTPTVSEGMVCGWSPLETLELGDDGQFISNGSKICFVNIETGDRVLIKKVRNKIIQFNDKKTTDEIDELFEIVSNTKNKVKTENKLIAKLLDNEYRPIEKGNYTLMVKDGSEPYLFMEANEELILLDINEIYSNEDAAKFTILNQGKSLIYDRKNSKIAVE